MGRSTGLQVTVFTGARVAGTLSFIPQHTKNGKLISARCDIPIYLNSHKGTNQKTGEQGRVDSYKVTAWGKLAETCCKSCPPGKALDLVVRPQSFTGRLFDSNGNQRVDNMGQPIEIPKVGFTIIDIAFGEDSNKHIANEIQQGIRPMQWNVQGTPDWQQWTQTLVARQAITWNGSDTTFGYARVTIPQGPGIALDFSKPGVASAPVAAAGGGGYNGMTTEQAVHNTFNSQPATSGNGFTPNFNPAGAGNVANAGPGFAAGAANAGQRLF